VGALAAIGPQVEIAADRFRAGDAGVQAVVLEQVVAGVGRAALAGWFLRRRQLHRVVEVGKRVFRRLRRALLANDVRFPVIEVQPRRLGRALGRLAEAGRPRDPDRDLVSAEARDLDLGDAELVAAVADLVDRAVDRVGVHRRLLRGRPTLEDELDAALKVEAEAGLLARDHRHRDGEQAKHEQQHEQVAAPPGHW